ncbi:MAG: transcriptional repressor LexA [Rhodospirillales bacterium]|nr:transcriptional repressor LexA [Rhodospirillales bacterium]
MLTHADVWRAIDRLAERHGLSTSGLARKAGLDPTTFNKSKRATADGRLRWPSTESIAKVLQATGSSLAELVGLTEGTRPGRHLPLLHLGATGAEAPFDPAGDPAGPAWDAFEFPQLDDPRAFALEISGDTQLPVYRDGDVLVITPSAPARRGDRVLLRTRAGDLALGTLTRQTATRIDLTPLAPGAEHHSYERDDVVWIARVRWACQ